MSMKPLLFIETCPTRRINKHYIREPIDKHSIGVLGGMPVKFLP